MTILLRSIMEQSKTSPVDPEIEAAVLRYMKVNFQETRYYWRMLRQDPERALKEIMCRKMSRMEELEKLAEALKPLVQQWAEQTPGLHACIEATIKNKILFPSIAYIEEAVKMKARFDMGSNPKAVVGASA
jgi:hypothetical protein